MEGRLFTSSLVLLCKLFCIDLFWWDTVQNALLSNTQFIPTCYALLPFIHINSLFHVCFWRWQYMNTVRPLSLLFFCTSSATVHMSPLDKAQRPQVRAYKRCQGAWVWDHGSCREWALGFWSEWSWRQKKMLRGAWVWDHGSCWE